jgi:hypothetical protein
MKKTVTRYTHHKMRRDVTKACKHTGNRPLHEQSPRQLSALYATHVPAAPPKPPPPTMPAIEPTEVGHVWSPVSRTDRYSSPGSTTLLTRIKDPDEQHRGSYMTGKH